MAEAKLSAVVQASARTSLTLDLLKGTISVSLSDGSQLWGTYHGTATVGSVGQSRATLEGEITGGTGTFAGAVGSFTGSGKGGFVNDGEFSVMLRATVLTAGRESLDLPLTLKGTSTGTCTTVAPPRVLLDGSGAAKANDRAVAHLEHDLGDQICAIIVE